MSYTKQSWADGPAGGTPISAARLNHMEDGIASASSSAAADAAQATANAALSKANTALTAANNAQSDVDALGATFEPVSGGFTAATGWSLVRGKVIKIGRFASCDISVNRTGATISGTPSGNIGNTLVGTVSSTFANWAGYQGITAGPGGSVNSVFIQGTSVYLAAYAPNTDIVAGTNITFAGPWITAS